MLKQTCAKVLMGAVLFAAPAFAGQDFLADVTQGAFQDTMHGVQPLTDSEKERVLGGYFVTDISELRNVSLGYGSSLVEVGVAAMLNGYEMDNRVACGINISDCSSRSYVNQQRYNEVVSIANPARSEYLVVTATKTTRPGAFGVSIPTFTYGTAVFNMRTGWLTRTNSSSYVASEMMQRFKNEMNRVLVTQYR
ncbi:MAG: hypothetical protein K2O85_04505 [Helicobacter sp.]|nr:hypothetical protein [Helicobacter sp.]